MRDSCNSIAATLDNEVMIGNDVSVEKRQNKTWIFVRKILFCNTARLYWDENILKEEWCS